MKKKSLAAESKRTPKLILKNGHNKPLDLKNGPKKPVSSGPPPTAAVKGLGSVHSPL